MREVKVKLLNIIIIVHERLLQRRSKNVLSREYIYFSERSLLYTKISWTM